MLEIRKKGIRRIVTKDSYNNKWKSLGFEIIEDIENIENIENIEDLTVKEIKNLLNENNIDYDSSMKKAELLELLER